MIFKTNLKFSIVLLLLLSSAKFIFSQENEYSYSTGDSLLNAALDIIEVTQYCALITTGSEGEIHVRTMDPFLPEKDMTIWFGTNKNSRKVSEIKKNPNVTLYYADPDGAGYVVLSGNAQLIDDLAEKEKRFKEEWKQFYPENRANYMLIKFTLEKMEVLNFRLGISSDPETWRVPVWESK